MVKNVFMVLNFEDRLWIHIFNLKYGSFVRLADMSRMALVSLELCSLLLPKLGPTAGLQSAILIKLVFSLIPGFSISRLVLNLLSLT